MIFALLVGVLVFGPSMWVQHVMNRYGRDRPDFPGTGGELARHLLTQARLSFVEVERTDVGDHYDAEAKVVRLTPRVMDGRSITAVAVAAHEVGHAIQDRDGYAPLRYRGTVLSAARRAQRMGLIIMLLAPALAVVTRSPIAAMLPLMAGVLVRGAAVVAAVMALPSEYDASFRKALPILQEGVYLEEGDIAAATAVLRAAAFTYVANAAIQVIFAGRGGLRF